MQRVTFEVSNLRMQLRNGAELRQKDKSLYVTTPPFMSVWWRMNILEGYPRNIGVANQGVIGRFWEHLEGFSDMSGVIMSWKLLIEFFNCVYLRSECIADVL